MKLNKVIMICGCGEAKYDNQSCRCCSSNRHKRTHQKGPGDAKRTSPSEANNAAGPLSDKTRNRVHASLYLSGSSVSQRRLLASLTEQMARWTGAGRCQSPGRDCVFLLLRVETTDNPSGASEFEQRQLHSLTSPVSFLCAPP